MTSAAVPIVCLVSLHSLCDRNKTELFVSGDLNLYNRLFSEFVLNLLFRWHFVSERRIYCHLHGFSTDTVSRVIALKFDKVPTSVFETFP